MAQFRRFPQPSIPASCELPTALVASSCGGHEAGKSNRSGIAARASLPKPPFWLLALFPFFGDDWPDGGDDTGGGGEPPPGRIRYVVDGVDVRAGIERTSYLGADGQLRTEEYSIHPRDEIKRCLLQEFATLDEFLQRWSGAERKRMVLDELSRVGIEIDSLRDAIPSASQFDVSDLLVHIAYDQKPLTRRERADRVKK